MNAKKKKEKRKRKVSKFEWQNEEKADSQHTLIIWLLLECEHCTLYRRIYARLLYSIETQQPRPENGTK